MTHTVRIVGSEIAFPCEPDQTVLEAAEAAGWEIPYSCRRGVCNTCLGTLISGEVDAPAPQDGQVLFCQAKPCTDLQIAPREIVRVDPGARKRVKARVLRITRVADDVALIQLRFPAGTKVKFKAGQYLEVILEDGARRSFSMANPPQQSDGALLHVRVVPGGRFSEQVLPALAAGSTLEVELPFGDFFLREASERPAVLVASGTGFAPMKSILEDAFRRGSRREFVLYWGARGEQDLYQTEMPRKWAAERSGFRFVPVLSEPAEGVWSGRTGLVHRAVMEDYASLAECEVYACGVNAMVNAARKDFINERGLPREAFYCDAFVTPADVAAATGRDTGS
jgi:NAD(P)H-flavin reductase/ferredoxin